VVRTCTTISWSRARRQYAPGVRGRVRAGQVLRNLPIDEDLATSRFREIAHGH